LEAIVYYITLPFIYLISLLPFPVLYLFSDFIYFLLYYCMTYRKAVVLQNLRNAFPEKTEQEINTICKGFYHYLCDSLLETFKTLTISKNTMLQHCYFHPDSLAMFEQLKAEQKSIIMVMGHQGQWEWAGNTFGLLGPHKLFVIYHPLHSKCFDDLMLKMRTRFGATLIPMKNTFKVMVANRKTVNATTFIADQTPMPESAYWTTFLNQDTPVYKGTELIAKKMNIAVVFARSRRVKRGYYELSAEIITENPGELADGVLTEMHTKKLEEDIIAQPETWLWSHRRWKHKRPATHTGF